MYESIIKRLLDIVISFMVLTICSPIFVFVAIMVRIKLGSPVIFKQERPGKDEKIFILYKFRTMTDEKDKNGKLLPDDKRLGRFGKILRSTSLDELPEFWNILKGDMSVVGPRPLLVQYLPLYNEWQKRRHEVKPGLTGLAMSKVRNGAGWDVKFKYDLEYVENISFGLDLKIIYWTIKIVIKREGINEKGYSTNSMFKGERIE
ncbi:MAG: sugar transferase [Lachnospiraceae bacterium]|nr:sugar transferase [Lachnospiraceae bacterium]